MTNIMMINPLELLGLRQAFYISRCLTGGQCKEDLVLAFGGDGQLVDMWISFLRHNHWVEEGFTGWVLTAKGKTWKGKISVS